MNNYINAELENKIMQFAKEVIKELKDADNNNMVTMTVSPHSDYIGLSVFDFKNPNRHYNKTIIDGSSYSEYE